MKKLVLFLLFLFSISILSQVAPPPKYKNPENENKMIIVDFLKASNYKKNLGRYCRNYVSKYIFHNKNLYDNYNEIQNKCSYIIESEKMTDDVILESFSSIPKQNLLKLTEIYKDSKGIIDDYDEFILIDGKIQNYIEDSILKEIKKNYQK